jgi:hypothetical protein
MDVTDISEEHITRVKIISKLEKTLTETSN